MKGVCKQFPLCISYSQCYKVLVDVSVLYEGGGERFNKKTMRLCICYIFSICVLLNEFIFQGNCGFVDFDTPQTALKAISLEDFLEYELIFSDEFETDNRNFYDGNDPKWTVMHKDDCELITYFLLEFLENSKTQPSSLFALLLITLTRYKRCPPILSSR